MHPFDFYKKRGLPTFIIIGTMKGGTSSLHTYLNAHPEISMSKQKETDFFLTEDHNGHDLNWYRSQFDPSKKVRGETSPNYTKRHLFPGVPERIHKLLPNVKLIYVVRDPIDRAMSNFMHAVNSGRRDYKVLKDFFKPPKDLKDKTPEYYYHKKTADYYYLNTSNYYYQIQPYFEYFSRDQILIVQSEKLKNERRDTLKKVFEFLSVDAGFDSDVFDNVSHQTKNKESLKKHGKPTLTPEQFKLAEAYIKPEIDRFRELTGEKFEDWSV